MVESKNLVLPDGKEININTGPMKQDIVINFAKDEKGALFLKTIGSQKD